jgi:hypothetical protein
MPHMTTEVLARLVDEDPTPDDATHLSECAACRDALDELRAQTRALRDLPPIAPPDEAWSEIARRIEREHARAEERRRLIGPALRVAAAIALVAAGAVGHALALRRADEPSAVTSDGAPGDGPRSSLVSASAPTSLDDAIGRLRVAEVIYRQALLDYSALASPVPPRDVVARLATLEAIVLTTRTALERAPADPVINTYHLAALAERETLLGQIR